MEGVLYIEVNMTDHRGWAGDKGRPARLEAMGRTGQRGLLPKGGCAHLRRWSPGGTWAHCCPVSQLFAEEVEYLDFYMELVGTKFKIPLQVTQDIYDVATSLQPEV